MAGLFPYLLVPDFRLFYYEKMKHSGAMSITNKPKKSEKDMTLPKYLIQINRGYVMKSTCQLRLRETQTPLGRDHRLWQGTLSQYLEI
jgi:hypothetical protein